MSWINSLSLQADRRCIWLFFPTTLTIQGKKIDLQQGEILIDQQNTDIFLRSKNDRFRLFEITLLKPGLQQKWSTPWRLARRDKDFGCTHFFLTIHLVSTNLPTTLVEFQDFHNIHFLTKLKIKPRDRSKVCVTKVWKQKCDETKFFVCSSRTSWYMTFFS